MAPKQQRSRPTLGSPFLERLHGISTQVGSLICSAMIAPKMERSRPALGSPLVERLQRDDGILTQAGSLSCSAMTPKQERSRPALGHGQIAMSEIARPLTESN